MKFLILLLFSFQALAVDYNCVSRLHKLKLSLDGMNTSVLVQDRQTSEYLWNGIVQEVVLNGNFSKIIFDTHQTKDLTLTVKEEDLLQNPDRIYGFIDGWTGRGFDLGSLHCLRK